MPKNISTTADYEQFKFFKSNRKIDSSKLSKFVEDSKIHPHLMELCPIIVTKDMEIVDGQHRFLACKANGIPVYYVQDDRVTQEDMINLNKNQKNWTLQDYINYHISNENTSFKKIISFCEEYSISFSLACVFLGFNRKTLVSAIKNGSLVYPSQEEAEFSRRKAIVFRALQPSINDLSKESPAKKACFSYSFIESIACLPREVDLDRFLRVLTENLYRIEASRGWTFYHQQFKSMGAL